MSTYLLLLHTWDGYGRIVDLGDCSQEMSRKLAAHVMERCASTVHHIQVLYHHFGQKYSVMWEDGAESYSHDGTGEDVIWVNNTDLFRRVPLNSFYQSKVPF